MDTSIESLKDEELMNQVIQGNEEAFRIIYKKYYGKICALAKQLLCGAYTGKEPEDVAEEVFELVIKYANKFDPDNGSFNAWVITITRNKCKNERGRSIFRKILHLGDDNSELTEEKLEEEFVDSIEDEIIEREYMKFVYECMEILSEEKRYILIMHFYEDMTYKEIGKILETGRTTIHARVVKAIDLIRTCLKNKGVQI